MATRITQKNPSNTGGFFMMLKANWLLIASILLILPVLYKYIMYLYASMSSTDITAKTTVNNAQNGTSSPNIISKKSFDIQKKYPNLKANELERYKTVTQQIALALGTNVEDNHFIFGFDLYNVKALNEDEAKVVTLLKTVPTVFPIVEDLYFNVFTRSRNLKTDLYQYLSDLDIKTLRDFYKRYKKNWL